MDNIKQDQKLPEEKKDLPEAALPKEDVRQHEIPKAELDEDINKKPDHVHNDGCGCGK